MTLVSTSGRLVDKVRVSAFLRAQNPDDAADPAAQSRFSALRRFAIETCTASATNANCTTNAGFTRIYTSATNAFPGGRPRPLAPDLLLREFDVPDTMATHVRLVALTNQCTGGPAYQGEQDDDPSNVTDCDTGSPQGRNLRAAELQVISQKGATSMVRDPVVVLAMDGPGTTAPGSEVTFTIRYTNHGPEPASNATVVDTLPAGLRFVSASPGATFDALDREVRWSVGTVAVGVTGAVRVRARVGLTVAPGTVLLNRAEFRAPKTVANPAVRAVTVLAL